ncbi:MAG TPA: DUF6132 family protein [Clostridia bacterium]|jgi:hypothetical protein|nr:MAG: hypothetical protein BWY35_01991 [Firmicutes bacterium ADurb.Bin248]HOG00152.1 DUF6132 family protein [Clostridia bacterium]HOS17665.1 DUF6132 family protein [Clostridia bacterium]HPK15551.1 DUF6132 family protein [Clostridia bacterium]
MENPERAEKPAEPAAKKRLLKHLPAILLTLLGAAGGYLYYRFVGCATGACPITSDPFVSTLYGGVLGFLVGTVVTPGTKK